MGLTEIPTRTDGSIGRVKQDARLPSNRSIEIPADEYNELLDTVIALAEAVGLRDGSTPDSLEERVQGIPVAYSATFSNGGGNWVPDPDTIYVRPGEDPDVLDGAVAVQSDTLEITIVLGTLLPTEKYIPLLMPRGSAAFVATMIKGQDSQVIYVWTSNDASQLDGFDLVILYPPAF